ncbi:hypothetical protein QE152_g40255 [Popillia japonica]|uniref:Uncharacterized protein n=1 Tax=Popillia japonica TaxID=7064 RepID=A0AAW1HS20_POPJA
MCMVLKEAVICNHCYGEWEFITDAFTIIYYKLSNSNTFNRRIVLDGRQLTDCIPDPEVMPENLESPPEKQYEEEIEENDDGRYDIIIRNLNPDMCGLQINVTYYITAADDTNMCNLLKHYNRRRECIPLHNHVMYAPYFEDIIEVTVDSMDVYDSMHYKEVRCGEDSDLGSVGDVRIFNG